MPNHTLDEVILGAASARSPYYFNGRLLTAEDLWAEHDAGLARERSLGRIDGSGVALGLDVSLSSSATASPIVVRITRGLALNRCGQVIELCEDITLALERPSAVPRTTAPTSRDFSRCAPANPSAVPSREGVYVLTVAPSSRKEGRAPVSGLGNGVAACNSGRLALGVQFRLAELSGHGFPPGSRLRNQLAWLCLGLPAEHAAQLAHLPSGATPPPSDPLRAPTGFLRLADAEVPIALLHWATPTRLEFIDLWAVRRRPVPPDPESGLGFLLGEVRNREVEAAILQFDAHLRAILAEPGSHASLNASQRFAHLPPVGILPVGANRPSGPAFLGPHATGDTVPLPNGSVRAVLRAALAREPWRVFSTAEAASASSGAVTPVHLYQVPSFPNHVLFARSARNESIAADVHYDNRVSALPEVETVQQAIDALSLRQGNCCTFVVSPGPGWEEVFQRIAPNQNAEICFQAGTYSVPGRVLVANKGHLRLLGVGPGSRLVATASESVLFFQNCLSVTLEHLHAEASPASASGVQITGLNGILTFVNCLGVDVTRLSLRSAPGTSRTATCITVRHASSSADAATRTSVRVVACHFEVGHEQVGMLLTNCHRTHVEDNTLRVHGSITAATAVGDAELRGRLRRHFIDNAVAGNAPTSMLRETNVTVSFNGHDVRFQTLPQLAAPAGGANVWQALIQSLNPQGMTSPTILLRHLLRIADRFILSGNFGGSAAPAAAFTTFRTSLLGQLLPSMSQGIVVGGQRAADVRILNNSIRGAQQGIHIGVSHREVARGTPDSAGTISVQGNTVHVVIPVTATRERHGIFVGNAASLLVENNHLEIQRATRMATYRVEGIRVFGHVGRRVILRANHLAGFTVGIRFEPRTRFTGALQWVIDDTLATGALFTTQIPTGLTLMRRENNSP